MQDVAISIDLEANEWQFNKQFEKAVKLVVKDHSSGADLLERALTASTGLGHLQALDPDFERVRSQEAVTYQIYQEAALRRTPTPAEAKRVFTDTVEASRDLHSLGLTDEDCPLCEEMTAESKATRERVEAFLQDLVANLPPEQLIANAEAACAGLGHLSALNPGFETQDEWAETRAQYLLQQVAAIRGTSTSDADISQAIEASRDAHLQGGGVPGCPFCD